jgi:hypothetical protein
MLIHSSFRCQVFLALSFEVGSYSFYMLILEPINSVLCHLKVIVD